MASNEHGSDQLSNPERAIATLIAAIMLVAGGIATFLTDNEVGVAALLIIGAAFGVLAVTGQTLRRIKIGDNETEFYSRIGRDAVQTAESENASPAEREIARELVERASDSASDVPSRVVDISVARAFEQGVLSALRRVSGTLQMSEIGGLDAVTSNRIGVDVRYRRAGRPPGQAALSQAGSYRPAVEAAALLGLPALLIVTNSAVEDSSTVTISDTRSGVPIKVRILQWTTETTDETIGKALRDLSGD